MGRDGSTLHKFSQLEEMVQTPVFELNYANPLTIVCSALKALQDSGQCCVLSEMAQSKNKIASLVSLYRSRKSLETIKNQILKGNSRVSASLVGVYPSLKDPICIYQLNTAAEQYVASNVLPAGESRPKRIAKYLATRLIGTHPATSNVMLVLRRE